MLMLFFVHIVLIIIGWIVSKIRKEQFDSYMLIPFYGIYKFFENVFEENDTYIWGKYSYNLYKKEIKNKTNIIPLTFKQFKKFYTINPEKWAVTRMEYYNEEWKNLYILNYKSSYYINFKSYNDYHNFAKYWYKQNEIKEKEKDNNSSDKIIYDKNMAEFLLDIQKDINKIHNQVTNNYKNISINIKKE